MNPRSLILIIVAGLGVFLVVMLTRNYLGNAQSRQPAQVAERVEASRVLVAARRLPVGTILKSEDVKWQAWPAEGLNEAYYTSKSDSKKKAATPTDISGKVVRSPMTIGEPVTRTALVSQGERGFLAAILTPGMRAVSVKVSPTSGIGGFVFPGDRVDVILTHTIDVSKSEQYTISETVFQNVRVLGVDQRTTTTADQVKVAKTATLEVTPKMAEKVAMLENIGALSLSLRSLAQEGEMLSSDPDSPPVGFTQSHTMGNEVSGFLPAMDADKGATLTVSRGASSTTVALDRAKKDADK